MYIFIDLGNLFFGIYYREIFIYIGNDMIIRIDIYCFFYVMYVYVNKIIFERIKRLLVVGILKSWFEVR